MKKNPLSNWRVVKHDPPHDICIWIKIVAHVRNNETGEIRKYHTDGIWDEEYNVPHTFIWEDGNYACDCNRQLFWWRAKNEVEKDGVECGDEKFSVNLVNPKTGEVFYKEF